MKPQRRLLLAPFVVLLLVALLLSPAGCEELGDRISTTEGGDQTTVASEEPETTATSEAPETSEEPETSETPDSTAAPDTEGEGLSTSWYVLIAVLALIFIIIVVALIRASRGNKKEEK